LALVDIWGGATYEEASSKHGVSKSALVNRATRHGLNPQKQWLVKYRKTKGEIAVDEMRELMHLANQELISRFKDPVRVAKMSNTELNKIAGTSADKVALKERWGAAQGLDNQDALSLLISRFSEMKNFKITVESTEKPVQIEDAKVVETPLLEK